MREIRIGLPDWRRANAHRYGAYRDEGVPWHVLHGNRCLIEVDTLPEAMDAAYAHAAERAALDVPC